MTRPVTDHSPLLPGALAPVGARKTAHDLAALERLRSDLLSTVAHEIRVPLTAIRTERGLGCRFLAPER